MSSTLARCVDKALFQFTGSTLEDSMDGPITRFGTLTLRSNQKDYHPLVRDKTGWEDFYRTWPRDYNIYCDKFDLTRSTYRRLSDEGLPTPDSETIESLRTGYRGPSSICKAHPGVIQGKDLKPEPAYRLHLSDRIANGLSTADSLEGVIPYGKPGDMCNAKSVTQRDFKWRARMCKESNPSSNPYEYTVHRIAKTDLHGRGDCDRVVKFDDDVKELYLEAPLIQMKTLYSWPVSCISRWPLGGILSVNPKHPCIRGTVKMDNCHTNDCSPKPVLELPRDRAKIFGAQRGCNLKTRLTHCRNTSLMDMYNPTHVYECWDAVPNC